MKAKEQVKSSSWQDALKTLDQLDAEASKPGNEAAREQVGGPERLLPRLFARPNLDHTDASVKAFAEFVSRQPNASIDRRHVFEEGGRRVRCCAEEGRVPARRARRDAVRTPSSPRSRSSGRRRTPPTRPTSSGPTAR
jgi:hypothetical protein